MVGNARVMLREAGTCGSALLLGAVTLACSDAHGHQPVMDASTGRDAGRDAAVKVLERTVRLELGKVAHRELLEGEDGSLVYGAVTYLAGAEVCVVSRRDAFAELEPFEPLQDPICVTSAENESLWLEPAPTNSDLLITVTKTGYLPLLRTHRTDDRDVPLPAWAPNLILALLEDEEAGPWIEPHPVTTEESGLLVLEAAVVGNADAAPGTPPSFWSSAPDPGNAWTEGARFSIAPPGGKEPIELTSRTDRPLFVALAAGTYRLKFMHDRLRCQPAGVNWALGFSFFTAEPHAVEVRILAGHTTGFSIDCFCVEDAANQRIANLGTCTLATTDAGSP